MFLFLVQDLHYDIPTTIKITHHDNSWNSWWPIRSCFFVTWSWNDANSTAVHHVYLHVVYHSGYNLSGSHNNFWAKLDSFLSHQHSRADGHKKTTIKVLVQYIAVGYISHPAYESWSNFKEELEVKFSPPWVELVSHEEVINNISCKKNDF